MIRRLLVSISAHGFGHAMQTAMVVNTLHAQWPDLQVTIRTALPRSVLSKFFARDFAYIESSDDIGMAMASPLEVRPEETALAYEALHGAWDEAVDAEAAVIAEAKPDLVLANVSYLAVAAAARAGVPVVAMSSLNWADVYWDLFRARPAAPRIHAEMVAAYTQADLFLLPEPSMPMAWLPQRRPIGILARVGQPRRRELAEAIGAAPDQRIVLVAFGGIAGRMIPVLPRASDVMWLFDGPPEETRSDIVALARLRWSFPDLLRSIDLIVTKPGYGTVAEATCNGTRVLYVRRGDWIEEPYLVDWLTRHAVCRELDTTSLGSPDQLLMAVRALLAQPERSGPTPTGGVAAAAALAPFLG